MSGEEYLTQQYCEAKPYWRSVHELSGGNYYSFNDLNYPEYWLDALGKYTQQKPSAAAKQLHRRVEAASVYRRRNQSRSVISYTREISPKNGAFGYADPPNTFHGNQNLQTLRGEVGSSYRRLGR